MNCSCSSVHSLVASLEHLLELPEYQGTTRQCTRVSSSLYFIIDKIKKNKSTLVVKQFAEKFTKSLSSIGDILVKGKGKSIATRRSYMWQQFHELTASEDYRRDWIKVLNLIKSYLYT